MTLRTLAALSALGLAAACTETAPQPAEPAPVAGTPPLPDAAGLTPMPPGLSSDERVIWNSLTEAARAEAAAFIANGGTLTQFVSV